FAREPEITSSTAVVQAHRPESRDIAAHLDAVISFRVRHRSDDLIDGIHSIRRQICFADRVVPGHSYGRIAKIAWVRALRGACNTPLRRDIFEHDLCSNLFVAVIAQPEFSN